MSLKGSKQGTEKKERKVVTRISLVKVRVNQSMWVMKSKEKTFIRSYSGEGFQRRGGASYRVRTVVSRHTVLEFDVDTLYLMYRSKRTFFLILSWIESKKGTKVLKSILVLNGKSVSSKGITLVKT